MTITTQQENQILRLGQAMFNAAPGANYLSEFSAYLDFGSSLADLAQSLSGTEAFLGKTYYGCVSSAEFADDFVNELVGNYASAADKSWATNYIVERMSAGVTQAGIISELTQTLSAVNWEDANWGVAATQYNIRIATKIIDNLAGNTASASAKNDAIDYIVWEMAANGKNTGQMVEWAITALDEMDHADSAWGDAAVLFDNRIEVSRYYSVDKAGKAIDLGTLQQVLAPVTTSAGSIATAISQFDSLLSGVARDGYLADTTLFIDLNGDRVRTLDETQVTTDGHGNFTFPAGAFGQIVASGGTDITTLLPFTGAFTAPAGATVVNPLTTLLQVFIEQGQGIDTAELTLAKALGVNANNFDVIHFDPLPTALNVNASVDQQALGLQLRAASANVANLMVAAGSLLQGAAGGEDKLALITAEQAVLKALANAINTDSDGVINFSDQAMLRSVLIESATLLCHNANVTEALGKITAMATDFAAIMAAAANNISNAVAAGGAVAPILVNIAQAEVVVQGDLANQLAVAAETGDLSGLLPGFTGDAFQDKTDQVIIGELDPNTTADDAAVAESNAAVTAIDITAPVMRSATVSADGKSVVIIYSEPLTGTAEAGDYGLTLSSGNTAITGATIGTGIGVNKVTLTLSNAIGSTATVSNLVYNAAAGSIDSIKDAAITPNSAATQTLVKVTNGSTVSFTPTDSTAPVMTSAAVSADGTKMVITYSEPLTGTAEAGDYGVTLSSGNLTSATSATIGTGVNANKVTLDLSLAIRSTTTVSNLTYTAADGIDNSIKDAAAIPNNAPTQTLATVINGSTLTVVPVDTKAPAMSSAAVSADGTKLVITYSEPLTGTAEAGDYAIALSSGSVTATAATIGTGAAANKVTLTLSGIIKSTNTVSNLVYTATAGTANSIKDTATMPNNAATQTLATVINGSTVPIVPIDPPIDPIDTTAPVMTSAVVSTDGTKLVITYSEPLTGTAEAGDYGVTLSSGNLTSATAATIGTGVDANKVTLDLSLAIRSTTTVSDLTYIATDGTSNSIKDTAAIANNAPTQTLATVINGSTLTVVPVDTKAPAMISAAVSADGTKLVITYSEPLTGTAEAGDYAIALSSGAVTATAATIGTGAAANKVTLTLSGIINSTNTVSNLVYTSTAGTANSIKDTATTPNNAATQTLATVINGSTVTPIPVDTTAPVMTSAVVSADGTKMVITYSEPLTGKAEADDYSVTLSSGNLTSATAATIGTGVDANKVTLDLSLAIRSTTTVSDLTYIATDGTSNSIKDAAAIANNAPTQTLATVINGSTLTVVPVDTKAPAMSSAAVSADGTKLVITYSEPLTGTAEAGDYAIALSSGAVTATAATIGTGAAANKVTLALSGTINSGTTVSNLAYNATAGTANSIKDTATTPNNAATQILATVINGSTVPTDTTAPVMTSAAVSADGTKMVITYSEPLTGTAEAGDYGVTLSSGNLTSATSATIGTGVNANKVTLDLSLAIRSTTTVSNLTYTAADGIDNSIKDAAAIPNNAPTQTLATVINGSTLTVVPVDTKAPAMSSAAVSADGTKLVITYSEPLTGTAEAGDYAIALSSGAVTATTATIGTGAAANKVTLTLSGTINSTNTVSNLVYTATAGTANSIKDTATTPNNAATQTLATVTNGSTVTPTTDATAPVISSAAVSTDGKSLVITYSEPLTGTAEAGDYGVTLSSGTTTATAAAIGAGIDANKVTLTLSNTINSGVIVSNLAYNATAGTANSIKDAATPANNAATQTLATVTNGSTVTSGGSTPLTLTTSNDTVNGTEGNDTFNATYDGGLATDTLGAGDKINGLGGSDTLNIDHFGNFAMTPPDSLWTGLSNIEKVVFNTTGDGAQTITTGTFFQAAFGTNGVDFKTTTSGAGAITMDLSTFTGRAVLTTTSIAGAQVIVTGSGVTSVIAASDAGALDIKGVGLATVIATTTGAGAQTIGDAGGSGANLTSVNATAVSGTQTITSTSTANATVIATSSSGKQLITTGDGNDTITATAAAGTTNTITTNAGNDTIVAGLGNDLITGGLGADQMTGGGGVDTFAIGGNGSIIGTSLDVITDFNFGGSDILTFGGATTVLAIDATLLVAGSNVQTTGGGVIVFHANDNTLALKIAAIQADAQLDTAGSIGMFVDGGNTYVYYAGAAAANADDQLIQLSGVTTLATITGGATTSIG